MLEELRAQDYIDFQLPCQFSKTLAPVLLKVVSVNLGVSSDLGVSYDIFHDFSVLLKVVTYDKLSLRVNFGVNLRLPSTTRKSTRKSETEKKGLNFRIKPYKHVMEESFPKVEACI